MRHTSRYNESDTLAEILGKEAHDTHLLLVNKYFVPPNVSQALIEELMDLGARKTGAPIQELEFIK